MKKVLFAAFMLLVTMGANAQEKHYGIKSGSVKYTSKVMDMDVVSTLYFDDYGLKESNITEQGGAYILQKTEGDLMLMWIMGTTTGIKRTLPSKPINYLSFTDEMIDKYQIIQLDEKQTVLGKECIGYNMVIEEQGIRAEVTTWVWNGIPLKITQKLEGQEIDQAAVELQENITIDADKFTIPGDVEFQEMEG